MEKCRGGSSLVNCSELVQAVIEYMKDNYPNNPEEFNFQAELKAACHWYWTKDGKALKEGPHVNCRIKTAAMKILTKWERELKELTGSQKQAESQRITGKVLFSVKSPMVLIVESFVGCSSIPIRGYIPRENNLPLFVLYILVHDCAGGSCPFLEILCK